MIILTIKRMTKQRQAILNYLKSKKHHPTADEIYSHVRTEIPNVSLGTIYRNLNILVENGEIGECSLSSRHDFYDGNPEPHYHFRCLDCGDIFDLTADFAQDLEKWAADKGPFSITGHKIEFNGYCNCCR